MSHSTGDFEACDCHSHVYGPYDRFPLSEDRSFDPPESPIELLENVWKSCGVSHAVLIQGSAYANDHGALLNGIARDPERRRGVAILQNTVKDGELTDLHARGIRAIRFNWVKHLRSRNARSPSDTLEAAAALASRVFRLGWHVEVHIDPECLEMVEQLSLPSGQVVVIDHMARINSPLGFDQSLFKRLLNLLDRENVWVKLSGADRIAAQWSSLSEASAFIAGLAEHAPDRCVWGLDWPHVNLICRYSDVELRANLEKAIPDLDLRVKILSENPMRLYGFPSLTAFAAAPKNDRGVSFL
jgi:2-pyrone-4,6-dicarboxylate lactonase